MRVFTSLVMVSVTVPGIVLNIVVNSIMNSVSDLIFDYQLVQLFEIASSVTMKKRASNDTMIIYWQTMKFYPLQLIDAGVWVHL